MKKECDSATVWGECDTERREEGGGRREERSGATVKSSAEKPKEFINIDNHVRHFLKQYII